MNLHYILHLSCVGINTTLPEAVNEDKS